MVIEEYVLVHAPLHKVWETFTHVTSWKDWNTVLRNASCNGTEVLAQGSKIRVLIHPFRFPVSLELVIDTVIPGKKVVWTSTKFGVSACHAFLFEQVESGILITSSETFKGALVSAFGFLFPRRKLQGLTLSFLKDLKRASEI